MIKENHHIQAGLFVTIGLLILTGVIFLLGRERQVFTRKVHYFAYFNNTGGLALGAPVRLGGITIGQVDKINFTSEESDPRIRVDLLLTTDYLDRIRENSVAVLQTQGLLGDQYVAISTGTAGVKIAPGGEIKVEEGPGLTEAFERAGDILDHVASLADDLKATVQDLRENTLVHLSSSSESIANITRQIETGDGVIHDLVFGQDEQDEKPSLDEILDNVNDIVDTVKNGDGLLHTLIYEDESTQLLENLTLAAEEITRTASTLAEISKEIRDGNGLAHSIIYDDAPEGFDEVVKKLNRTASNLEATSKALASGSGTLGALIVDPSLYENLVEVTDDAKRSYLLRQLIRSSLKK